jgi:HEAT repeats/HEAT-like repeat
MPMSSHSPVLNYTGLVGSMDQTNQLAQERKCTHYLPCCFQHISWNLPHHFAFHASYCVHHLLELRWSAWLLAVFFLVSVGNCVESGPAVDTWKISGTLVALQDTDPDVQITALSKLGSFKSLDTIPRIVALLDHDNIRIRIAAIEALSAFGPAAVAYVPKFVIFLQGTEAWQVRAAAARALGEVGLAAASQADWLVDKLTALLDDKHQSVRANAVWALRIIGPMASNVPILSLIDLVKDKEMRFQAESALRAIRPREAAHASRLADVVRNSSRDAKDTRLAALQVLRAMGPATASQAS